jgi:hypothetical protein
MIRTILTAIFSVWSLTVFATERESAPEWKDTPEKAIIREIVNEIDKLEYSNALRPKTKRCHLGRDKFDFFGGILYKDKAGVVRKYLLERELTVHAGIVSYYYDLNGTPRYTKRNIGGGFDFKNEDHIYFDEKGLHLYTDSVKRNHYVPIDELPDVLPNPNKHFLDLCKGFSLLEGSR